VTATLDGTPERFTEMSVVVSAARSEPELFQKLVGIAERSCAVSNTLRDVIRLTFNIERPPAR
jgi:organic hydroperoxide reductase OsmC/OhrA